MTSLSYAVPLSEDLTHTTEKKELTPSQLAGTPPKKPLFNTPSLSEEKIEPSTRVAQAETIRRDVSKKRKTNKSLFGREVLRRNNQVVTLLTGDISSTEAKIAADIANVIDNIEGNDGLRVVPILGRGGVENVKDVLFLKGVDMAIISQGHLSFLESQDPEFYKDIRGRIHYITKLYNSEMQILANRKIDNILQLSGKRVVFGKKFGATDLDARNIFTQLGVEAEVVNVDFSNGLDQLENNKVDAIVTFGGAPVEGFRALKDPSKFHFLPITPQTVGLKSYFKITDEYLPTKLTAKEYPKLIAKNKPISTISSNVVLVSYRWKSTHKRYKKLSRFVQAFFKNFYSFEEKSSHPKWQEINIDTKLFGWSQFGAASEWLKNRRKEIGQEVSAGEMKIAMDAFVRQYSKIGNAEQVTPLLRDDIWASMTRVFGRWWAVGL